MLRKLLNLFWNRKEKEVDVQAVFDKVFSHYPPDLLRKEKNFYMCILLREAEEKDIITAHEMFVAIDAINEYIFPYVRLDYALKANNLDNSVNHRIAIYFNWERRPKLEEL